MRSGRARFVDKDQSRLVRGPYYFDKTRHENRDEIKIDRKGLLRMILETQEELRREGPDPEFSLISMGELEEIRRLWITEESDWADSVPRIFREVTGKDYDWSQEEMGLFDTKEWRLLDEIAERHGVPPRLLAKLLDVERQHQGMARRASILNKLDSVLREEWRSEDEILKDEGVVLAEAED